MKTNTSITIYHKYFDKDAHLDKWKRQIIPNVMFQGGKGASANKGYEMANDVDVFIPLNKNDLSNIDINIGDILVRGSIDLEINMQSDLNVTNFNITSIEFNDYGSANVNHIQIGAK